MKVEVRLDEACTQTTVVITAARMTGEIEQLVRRLRGETVLAGFRDGEAELLDPVEIQRVYARGGRVYARTGRGEFDLRMRLYEAEARLEGGCFVRISNAEIINLRMVRSFDLRLSGTIQVRFLDGEATYVSRRYVGRVKRMLGIGGERA